MRRSKRIQARQSIDAAKSEQARRRQSRRNYAAQREAMIAEQFTKARRGSLADRFLHNNRFRPHAPGQEEAGNNHKLAQLARILERKAPRLLQDDNYKEALRRIARFNWLRELDTWVPRGKGRDTRYRSLCEHLFAKYPMPKFFWSVFLENDPERPPISQPLSHCIIRIAQGESMFKMLKDGDLAGPPMTRKVIHDFMITPGNTTFMRALRRAQIRGHGGSTLLYEAWCRNDRGAELQHGPTGGEAFWDTVIRWACRNPMMDLSELPNLIDYIAARKRADPDFSMKGRSVLAMIRNMNDWHRDLTRTRNVKKLTFAPSGFKPGTWYTQRPKAAGPGKHRWDFHEVLTSQDLLAEGRYMKHCVYSYTHSIQDGFCSIWSMRCDSERMLTVEVRHNARAIVQARGKCNRVSTAQEMVVLKEWARKNKLDIRLGHW